MSNTSYDNVDNLEFCYNSSATSRIEYAGGLERLVYCDFEYSDAARMKREQNGAMIGPPQKDGVVSKALEEDGMVGIYMPSGVSHGYKEV